MLKSGGPKMTVIDNNRKMGAFSDQDACYCMWWNDEKYDYATFPNVCLVFLEQQSAKEPQILNEVEDDGFYTLPYIPARPKKYILDTDETRKINVFYTMDGNFW